MAADSTEASTDTTAEEDQAAAEAAAAEEGTGSLPGIVVFLVNLVASLEQIFILTLVGWPIQILLWVVTLVDVIWSNTLRFLIGSWSKLLAYVFIFPVKIVLLPFTFFGWAYRIFFAVAKFPINGWMLFFGNGCFLRWGNDCSAKKWSEREYYNIFTLPWWMRDPESLMPKLPEGSIADSLAEHFEIDTYFL